MTPEQDVETQPLSPLDLGARTPSPGPIVTLQDAIPHLTTPHGPLLDLSKLRGSQTQRSISRSYPPSSRTASFSSLSTFAEEPETSPWLDNSLDDTNSNSPEPKAAVKENAAFTDQETDVTPSRTEHTGDTPGFNFATYVKSLPTQRTGTASGRASSSQGSPHQHSSRSRTTKPSTGTLRSQPKPQKRKDTLGSQPSSRHHSNRPRGLRRSPSPTSTLDKSVDWVTELFSQSSLTLLVSDQVSHHQVEDEHKYEWLQLAYACIPAIPDKPTRESRDLVYTVSYSFYSL